MKVCIRNPSYQQFWFLQRGFLDILFITATSLRMTGKNNKKRAKS